MGFEKTVSAEDESDFQYLFAQDLSNLPNIHVEVDNDGPYIVIQKLFLPVLYPVTIGRVLYVHWKMTLVGLCLILAVF